MTMAQLEELKALSVWEVTKRYLPRLTRREITPEQYQWLLGQAQKPVEVRVESRTTHEDDAAGRSQKERLLSVLSDHEWHTTRSLLEKVYGSEHYGGARLAARVSDLKADGHTIESRHESGSVWSYHLVP